MRTFAANCSTEHSSFHGADQKGPTRKLPIRAQGNDRAQAVTLRLAELYGSRIEGAVVIDSPIRDLAPEEHAAAGQRVFRQLRVYPTRQEALARFRPVIEIPAAGHHIMLDQPVALVAALVAALRTLLSDWDHSLPAEPRGALAG